CTPYLLQLGLTKSKTSLVWIAGPLSGLIMQPVVGVLADSSRSKYGRRRPFMVGGALIVGLFLLVLGWTTEIVGLFIREPELKRLLTITLAVFSIYVVDFAINAGRINRALSPNSITYETRSVQASCRSLIVDTLPIPKQQLGSAWDPEASRMIAIGHLIGYGAGTIDLVKIFGTALGDSQFKQLTAIAAASLISTVLVTSYAVKERVLISVKDADAKAGAFRMVSKILKTTWHLPDRIQAICWVQFWAWIGWFPFLFYSTTWVGETYFRYSPHASIASSTDPLGDIGRVGSLSLVVFSIITFLGSVVLPLAVRSPDNEKQRNFTPRPPAVVAPIVEAFTKYKPDLLTAWMISHMIFAAAMIFAPLVRSLQMATILVSICGIPWALTCWAPFAFMGIEINRLTAPNTILANGSSYRRLSNPPDDFSSPAPSPTFLRLNHLDRSLDDSDGQDSSTGELAGIYLGILNLFTTLPQFVGTFISMVVFSILEPGVHPELHKGESKAAVAGEKEGAEAVKKVTEGPNGIAVCLSIGAVCAVGAAYATQKMKSVYGRIP
ncbi:MAG: hypothetical protein Q9214_005424, partial [Letrouitia sp. 1 TL-2023]